MRFLVITDLHQKASRIPRINDIISDSSIDCVLFLGDVTDLGTNEDAVKLLSSINSKVLFIPGNCDPLDLPDNLGTSATDMHGKCTNIGGIDIVGLGGSNITIFGTPFELEEDDIYNGLKSVSKEGMLLMTHVPSYGILDTIPNGMHVGSPSVKRIVDEFKPIIALSGHIHEAIGCETINGTVFVNPGPAKDGYLAILDINNGKVDVKLLGPRD